MSSSLTVVLRGSGVAASCCQFLLRSAGCGVRTEDLHRPRVPALMLSESTQTLLGDVFERTDLLHGLWRIERRVVAWGSAAPVELPHQAIVVSERELLDRLHPLEPLPAGRDPEWTIHTSRVPDSSDTLNFGSRSAEAIEVRLAPWADPQACVMESTPSGWLFLLPVSGKTAWLLSAGAAFEESRLVRRSVAETIGAGGSFPAYPRLIDPLAGDGWLACGSAALGFDPLCGDGTGHAVREAILACAVVRSCDARQDLIWEYRLRLWAGLRRHLELCQPFYATGGTSAWWQREAEGLRQGLDWLARQPAPVRLGRFRLNGFRLDAARIR